MFTLAHEIITRTVILLGNPIYTYSEYSVLHSYKILHDLAHTLQLLLFVFLEQIIPLALYGQKQQVFH